MKLYRCWSCGVKLVNDKNLKRHAGHTFHTPGNISWYEYPKVWLWMVQEWLKK